MKIYEIDKAIENMIDQETGEIADFDAFMELQMERNDKIENMACWYLDLCGDAQKIREQEKVLSERRKVLEHRADSLKNYLDRLCGGEKFTTPKVSLTYRKSKQVEVTEEFINFAKVNCANLLRYKEPEPDKKAIGDLLKNGETLPGAEIIEKISISIK